MKAAIAPTRIVQMCSQRDCDTGPRLRATRITTVIEPSTFGIALWPVHRELHASLTLWVAMGRFHTARFQNLHFGDRG